MNVAIEEISLLSRLYGDEKLNTDRAHPTPPMLYPANIQGTIVLPKIVSQMIQKQPLLTKFCQLDLKADHLVVDFCALNAIEVLNFTYVFFSSLLTQSLSPDCQSFCIDCGILLSWITSRRYGYSSSYHGPHSCGVFGQVSRCHTQWC